MALDPAIALQAGHPTVSLASPIEQWGQVANVQNAMNQNQMGQIQVQQARQQLRDSQLISQAFTSGNFDLNSPQGANQFVSYLGSQGVSGKTLLALQQNVLQRQAMMAQTAMNNARADSFKGQAAVDKAKIQQGVGDDAWAFSKQVFKPDGTPNMSQQDYLNGLAQIQKRATDAGIDLGGLDLVKQFGQMTPESVTSLNHLVGGFQTYIRQYQQNLADIKNEREANAPLSDKGKLAHDMGLDVNDPKVDAEYLKLHPRNSTQVTLQPAPLSAAAAAERFAADPNRPWRTNPAFQDLAQKDGNMASDVDAALNNDYKFGGTRGIQYDRQVQHATQQIDPSWRQGNYDLKQRMLADPQVTAANAAVMHMKDFMDDYNRLSPKTSSVLLNTPVNKWTSLVNGNSPEAAILARLQATAKSVAGEYGKALGSSDAVISEQARENLFNPSKTGGQLSGVTGAIGTLIQRTVNAKENITRRTSPNSQPLTLMDPDSINAMRTLGISYSPGGSARTAPQGGMGRGSQNVVVPPSPTAYRGLTATEQDLQDTANQTRMTVDQVRQRWLAGGGTIK